jgi:hypothetical protein
LRTQQFQPALVAQVYLELDQGPGISGRNAVDLKFAVRQSKAVIVIRIQPELSLRDHLPAVLNPDNNFMFTVKIVKCRIPEQPGVEFNRSAVG